jgi:MoaA/NifB/PqqE/SkfB family radical SAM enzyme
LNSSGADARTGVGLVSTPVLQIHGSLTCNLSCTHCYSSSGPTAHENLPVERVSRTIEDAAAIGYGAVAFSGGEPLIYPGLTTALTRAKALGVITSLTTNGTLLDRARVDELRDLVDVLAVSLDGPPNLHNRMRGSSTAFDRMLSGVANAQAAGIRIGFIHTLTRESWEHLPWLAEFAHRNGAALFQVHPLEMYGRAGEMMRAEALDQETLGRAYLLGFALLAKYQGEMAVQLDVVHRDQLLRDPARVYATDCWPAEGRAGELLGIIVLEPDGSVVPVAYGFSRRFRICNVNEEPLSTAWHRYATVDYPAFRRLCRDALTVIDSPDSPDLINWHEFIVQQSLGWHETPPGPGPSAASGCLVTASR